MSARILTLTGTVHPKAEILTVDAAHGVASFRWLDAAAQPVDSGSSLARFTPLDALPTELGEPTAYPEVSDETLADAIEHPAEDPAPPVVLTPLTLISRLTGEERAAIFSSTDPAVAVWRGMATAAQEIRSDDPRTEEGFALLVYKGLLAPGRPAQLMLP